ncbi:MAG: hypothetical protein IPO06_29560 [Leptospiraceae bacterium]|nr:hypothetical protein [Leptospiraceae bacterium]MBP6738351.1 hypothetical protein [Leptospiraceae bacterium]
MNTYTLTYCISEPKLNSLIAKKGTPEGKAQIKKLFPVTPLSYKRSFLSKDSAIQVKTVLEKTEKGYLFFKSVFTFPKDGSGKSYITGYEQSFEKFCRNYIASKNSLVGVLLITGKFSDVSNTTTINLPLPPRPDSKPVEPKQPANSNLPQPSEPKKEIIEKNFFVENKNIIIGGTIATGVLIAVVIATK